MTTETLAELLGNALSRLNAAVASQDGDRIETALAYLVSVLSTDTAREFFDTASQASLQQVIDMMNRQSQQIVGALNVIPDAMVGVSRVMAMISAFGHALGADMSGFDEMIVRLQTMAIEGYREAAADPRARLAMTGADVEGATGALRDAGERVPRIIGLERYYDALENNGGQVPQILVADFEGRLRADARLAPHLDTIMPAVRAAAQTQGDASAITLGADSEAQGLLGMRPIQNLSAEAQAALGEILRHQPAPG